ncbi:4'-phosphopantetheinyl transferase superfamily protein [Cohnella sp. WQ 127256]|uniref:4'-phosphopantetheinyl transferase family protein n=1 Tax=Cohnella sp. WQ 127256 TaxID=2938790 RepID=UPI00355862AC
MIKRLSPYVSKSRLDKAIRFKQANDFNRSIVSELLVNYILLTKHNMSGQRLDWGTHKSGKPYLLAQPGLYFNLSHTADYVACVFDHAEIGIDIEYIRDFQYSSIAIRNFTLNENSYISKQSTPKKLNAFYKIWTQKESYLKAIGSGLFTPLDSFEIQSLEENETQVHTPDQTWILRTLQIEPDYMLSVCRSTAIEELIANPISLEDISSMYPIPHPQTGKQSDTF